MTTTEPRVPQLTPDRLDADQKQLYDTLVEGPRGSRIVLPDGSLFGPFNLLLLSPQVGDRLQALGLAVQRETKLPAATREAVILSVVHRRESRSEWNAHRPMAINAGLTEADIEAIQAGEVPPDVDKGTRAALALTAAQLARRPGNDPAYEAAVQALGDRRALEVCLLAGYYESLCSVLVLFALG